MFPNNGPVAAQQAVRTYIATVGLSNFPEAAGDAFEKINTSALFETLTTGTERLLAAAVELPDLPSREAALRALGEAAQAAALAYLSGKEARWWAIQAWAAAEISDPGGEHLMAPQPDVDPDATFVKPNPVEPPVA